MAQGGAHYREDCKTAMIRYEQRGNSDAYFRWRENILNLAESKRSYQHGPMDEQGRNLYLFSAYRDWVGAEFDDAVAVEAESKQQFDITNRWQHDQQIIVSLGEPVSYLEKLAEDAKKDVPSSRKQKSRLFLQVRGRPPIPLPPILPGQRSLSKHTKKNKETLPI